MCNLRVVVDSCLLVVMVVVDSCFLLVVIVVVSVGSCSRLLVAVFVAVVAAAVRSSLLGGVEVRRNWVTAPMLLLQTTELICNLRSCRVDVQGFRWSMMG